MFHKVLTVSLPYGSKSWDLTAPQRTRTERKRTLYEQYWDTNYWIRYVIKTKVRFLITSLLAIMTKNWRNWREHFRRISRISRRMGSGCTDPRFLDLGTSWRSVVSFSPLQLYPRGNKREANSHIWTESATSWKEQSRTLRNEMDSASFLEDGTGKRPTPWRLWQWPMPIRPILE
jgi:hypothetical protein